MCFCSSRTSRSYCTATRCQTSRRSPRFCPATALTSSDISSAFKGVLRLSPGCPRTWPVGERRLPAPSTAATLASAGLLNRAAAVTAAAAGRSATSLEHAGRGGLPQHRLMLAPPLPLLQPPPRPASADATDLAGTAPATATHGVRMCQESMLKLRYVASRDVCCCAKLTSPVPCLPPCSELPS